MIKETVIPIMWLIVALTVPATAVLLQAVNA